MKKYRLNLLINLFLLTTFLVGCAFIGVNRKGEKAEMVGVERRDESPQQISNVRVSEFILGAGDTIEITVYRHDDLKRSIKIDTSGKIMLHLIGDVQAAGKGVFELRDEIKERLSKYLVDPQVTISITAVQSQKIMVLGEVKNPGIFTLDSEISVMEAISKAGGMTEDAKLNNVLLITRKQGKPEAGSLDLKKAFKEGDISENRRLQSGDIVYVPAVAIANVSWFFGHLSKILSTIVNLETGIILWPQLKDVFKGEKPTTPLAIPAR